MRIRDTPTHHDHEEKSKKQEQTRSDAILNPDRLVISGEKILLPPWENVMVIVVVIVAVCAHRAIVNAIVRKEFK